MTKRAQNAPPQGPPQRPQGEQHMNADLYRQIQEAVRQLGPRR